MFLPDISRHQLIEISSWSRIRQTEGWAGLQHHCVLHTILTIFPPTNLDRDSSSASPHLHVNLVQGSFIAILPRSCGNRVTPGWHSGNIYSMERSLSRIIDLPSTPSLTSSTAYDVFVSGDYEVRDLAYNPRSRLTSVYPDTVVWRSTSVQQK